MKQGLLLLFCLFTTTVFAQTTPKWTWAQADNIAAFSSSLNYSKHILATGKARILSGQLQTSKLTASGTSYGNYKLRVFDTANNLLDSTTITGKVALLDAQADTAGNWYILGTYWDSLQFAGGFSRTVQTFTDPTYFIFRLNKTNLALDWFNFVGADYYSQCNNFFVQNSTIYMPIDSALLTTFYKVDAATGVRTAFTSQWHGGRVSSVVADSLGNLYVAGACPNVNPTFNGYAPTVTSPYAIYIVRYRKTGAYDWSLWMNDITCTYRQLTYGNDNNIFYTGPVNDSLTLGAFHVNKPVILGANLLVASIDSTGFVKWVRQTKDSNISRVTLDVRNAVWGSDTTIIIMPQIHNYVDWGNGFSTNVGTKTGTALVAYKMDGTVKWLKEVDADFSIGQHIKTNGRDIWVAGNVRDSFILTLDTISIPLLITRVTPFIGRLGMPYKKTTDTTTTQVISPAPDVVKLYPNPATGTVHLAGLQNINGGATVKISDICGRVFYNKHLSAPVADEAISVEALPRGVYIIELRSTGGTVVKKLLLQ